ncbi:hypothetical protein RF11_06399 [Thelohanellus kitauei]|uniref:Uncharacterized protein n=1 Tax=Thelohanellus kitauei TaxID=669202 RepID=A0A0C2N028_THEKT|nr:hypothetical protein RF11_06399 [Thelohanellus kitauei]
MPAGSFDLTSAFGSFKWRDQTLQNPLIRAHYSTIFLIQKNLIIDTTILAFLDMRNHAVTEKIRIFYIFRFRKSSKLTVIYCRGFKDMDYRRLSSGQRAIQDTSKHKDSRVVNNQSNTTNTQCVVIMNSVQFHKKSTILEAFHIKGPRDIVFVTLLTHPEPYKRCFISNFKGYAKSYTAGK